MEKTIEVEETPTIYLPYVSPNKLAKIIEYINEKGVAIENRRFLSLKEVGKFEQRPDGSGEHRDVKIEIQGYGFKEARDYTLEVTKGLMGVIFKAKDD